MRTRRNVGTDDRVYGWYAPALVLGLITNGYTTDEAIVALNHISDTWDKSTITETNLRDMANWLREEFMR